MVQAKLSSGSFVYAPLLLAAVLPLVSKHVTNARMLSEINVQRLY